MNGIGGEVKLPWWVQAIGVIGSTACIALYLVYWVTTSVAVKVERTEGEVAEILRTVQESNASTADTNRSIADSLGLFRRRELKLLKQTCLNAAKYKWEVDKCNEPPKDSEDAP